MSDLPDVRLEEPTRPPGDRHGGAAAVRPGPRGPEERPRPRQRPARPGGGLGAPHRDLDGIQQRLRHQPRQGPRTPTVRVLGGMGERRFHVSRSERKGSRGGGGSVDGGNELTFSLAGPGTGGGGCPWQPPASGPCWER